MIPCNCAPVHTDTIQVLDHYNYLGTVLLVRGDQHLLNYLQQDPITSQTNSRLFLSEVLAVQYGPSPWVQDVQHQTSMHTRIGPIPLLTILRLTL